MLKRRHFTALAGATALSAPMVARGQARWKPEKPITIYNPFAAGGVTDVHIRMLGETVTKVLGQQVIVDVKAGRRRHAWRRPCCSTPSRTARRSPA